MGIFDGCLIACDVDDTLVDGGYINPKNVEKIEYFMSEGGFFAIATGRSVTAISLVTDTLKRISPSVLSNGCMIYDYQKGKVLSQKILKQKDYFLVKDALDENLDLGIEVHTGDRIFTIRQTDETDFHQSYENLETTVISFEKAQKYEWNKVLFTAKSIDGFKRLKEISKKYSDTSHFVITGITMGNKRQNYFEQMPIGISKASAISELCQMFNIKKGCLYAIGDYYNDVEMLKKADICAVPCKAPDDIKALADYVTVSCRDGAVADFIDYLTNTHI